ncbi:MAG: hypothetical protein BWY19_01198 [bacterium ADurb.Bin212]|nr:MAG: hypothetical protein BWY19_01198 [bacterium ADurb.Bin212]
MKKVVLFFIPTIILIIALAGLIYKMNWDSKFKAPNSSWVSEKEVSDYFIEKLNMSPEEAKRGSSTGVTFRVRKDTTIDSIINNLTYYGLAKDKEALKYALEHTKDSTPGKENAIIIGEGSIDINANYVLSKNMTAWEVADTLLNKPDHWDFVEPYSYIFMPIKPE